MSKIKIDQKEIILSFSIQGIWSGYDYELLFISLNRLYDYYSICEDALYEISYNENEYGYERNSNFPLKQSTKIKFLKSANIIFNSDLETRKNFPFIPTERYHFNSFQVSKIKYNSPGIVDILGAGKVIKSLKEAIFYYIPNKKDKLENKKLMKEIKIKAKDIKLKDQEIQLNEQEIIRKKIDNLERLGLDPEDIRIVLGYETSNIQKIKLFIDENKITDIEIIQKN